MEQLQAVGMQKCPGAPLRVFGNQHWIVLAVCYEREANVLHVDPDLMSAATEDSHEA